MTVKIKLDTEGLNNIKRISQNSKEFNISINGNSFSLPLYVAAYFSEEVTNLLSADTITRDLNICMDFRNYENISKLISILSSQSEIIECSLSNKKDAMDFAEFGYRIGNKGFISPLLSFIEQEKSNPLTSKNVIERIEEKRFLSFITDKDVSISNELSFIKRNFSSVSKETSFSDWCLNEVNSSILEEIVMSDELRLSSEDDLLSFIIKINRGNKYVHLFRYVHLEFCSISMCKKFVDFIKCDEVFQSSQFRDSILSCIECRLFYDFRDKGSFESVKHRYSQEFCKQFSESSFWQINEENTKLKTENREKVNDILLSEYKKGNALIEPSSLSGFPNEGVDKLFDERENTAFATANIENSFIKASLKDGKTFILDSYKIKGHSGINDCQIENWKLEGERFSDGKWILLDQHNRERFGKSQTRTFNILCKDRLKSVKLTHIGKRPFGDYYLCISSFDISGLIIK